MKKLLSILLAAAITATSSSLVFADSGKNPGRTSCKKISSKVNLEDSIRSLKAQMKAVHGNKADRKGVLIKIAALKKQTKNCKVDVYVDGEEIPDGTPVFRYGRALLPLKPIIKALGATYEIRKDGAVTKIIIKKDNITLTLTTGSDIMLVSDAKTGKTVEFKLENKVETNGNGTFIPLGVIQKLISQMIDFDKDAGSIIIEDGKPVNLAYNMPVAATSTYDAGLSAIYAVDGRQDTRWSSEYTSTAAFTVDLGAVKSIGKVKLIWEAAYARAYAVQVSSDNLAWSDAAVVANGDGGIDELAFGPVNARYVRLDLRERALPSYGYSIYEFEVYPSNIKAEATVKGKDEALLGTVNLAAEGVIDWAHWGLSGLADFNHKDGVAQQISNFNIVGKAAPYVAAGNLINYTWTGGTPTAGASATANAVYVKGEGNGFTLTVPAGLTQRTLKVYAGALDAKGRLEARLSDGSVPYVGYIDSQAALKYKVFTIDFKAASAGQALTIKFTVDKAYDADAGDISLQAAALK
jgi:hypothetical protein